MILLFETAFLFYYSPFYYYRIRLISQNPTWLHHVVKVRRIGLFATICCAPSHAIHTYMSRTLI